MTMHVREHLLASATLPAPERKDGDDNAVLDLIKKEIKAFGDDTKSLRESLQKDLADVRKIAEEAKGGASAEVRTQIEALTKSVAEKQTALEESVKKIGEQAERVEIALKRPGIGGSADDQAAEHKAAIDYFTTKAARAGELKVGSPMTVERVDMEGYRAWSTHCDLYLRRDAKAVEAKALSVGSDPDGGYLVTPAMSSRILTIVRETSPLRQLATIENVGTDALELPIDEGDLGFEWVGETETPSETTTPQIGKQRIPVHEMAAKPHASNQMLEDASINVEDWLARKVADRFARGEATAFVSGNGVKRPRGILSYPSGTARGQIERVASGLAAGVKADALIGLVFALKEPYLSNATWLMKRSTVAAIMILKDGQGQYLWRPGLEAGKPSVLLGYPVRQADDMPVVEASALPIAFGDFRAGYTIVDRLGITTLRDPYSAKPFVQFYTRRRVGGDVTNFEAFKLMVVSAS